ncbi:hypothetical protein HYY73_02015 [Candidatus Woesearchaeota archaeon]|nr:hypothetical protein [Candidatus Woesearchaeota archaeon]
MIPRSGYDAIVLLTAVVLAISFLIGGCTQQAPVAVAPKNQSLQTAPVATAPISASTTDKEPVEIALQLNELPNDWRVINRTNITRTQMGKVFLTLGWQSGQTIQFLDPQQTTTIVQAISIYPFENISQILIKNRRVEVLLGLLYPSMTYENITDPEIGNESIAYKIIDKTKKDSPIIGYQIEFSKENAYVEIAIFGKSLDYELLKAIALKAAAKIT